MGIFPYIGLKNRPNIYGRYKSPGAAKTRPPKPVVLDANTLANAVNLESEI